MSSSKKMTNRERGQLVRFVLAREWVLLAIATLTLGISLSFLLSTNSGERLAGLVLAGLVLLATALFVWIRLEQDLRAGQVAQTRVHVYNKRAERREATVRYLIIDDEGIEYEVSHHWFRKLAVGESYQLFHTPQLRIVLAVERL